MKKFIFVLLALVVLAVSVPVFAEGELIGVAMPTNSLQRWNQDGNNMKTQLEKAGYKVILEFANNDVALQISQLENMILNDLPFHVHQKTARGRTNHVRPRCSRAMRF